MAKIREKAPKFTGKEKDVNNDLEPEQGIDSAPEITSEPESQPDLEPEQEQKGDPAVFDPAPLAKGIDSAPEKNSDLLDKLELPIRFTSPYRNFYLVIEPSYTQTVQGRLVSTAPVEAQFANWEFMCYDRTLARRLVQHKSYGRSFSCPKLELARKKI